MAQTKTSTTTKKTTARRKPTAKPAAKAAPKKTAPVKLDANCFQFEILELASKQRSNAKKSEILKEYINPGLKALFIWNFDESVVSMLPPGPVPYSSLKDQANLSGDMDAKIGAQIRGTQGNAMEDPMKAGRTSIRQEYTKFYNFIRGGNDSLSSIRRETMFIQLLEGLHPKEAEILIAVKDKKLSETYKITLDNVKEAFPEIRWGGRS